MTFLVIETTSQRDLRNLSAASFLKLPGLVIEEELTLMYVTF